MGDREKAVLLAGSVGNRKLEKAAYTELCRGGHSDLCHLPACRGRFRSLPKCILQLPAAQQMHGKDVTRPHRYPVPEQVQQTIKYASDNSV